MDVICDRCATSVYATWIQRNASGLSICYDCAADLHQLADESDSEFSVCDHCDCDDCNPRSDGQTPYLPSLPTDSVMRCGICHCEVDHIFFYDDRLNRCEPCADAFDAL